MTVWVLNVAPSVKLTTAKFYRDYVRRYTVDIAALPPEQLRPHHIQQLYAKLLQQGLSSSTVHHLHAVLHRAFDSGVKQGLFLQNYCDLIDAPRVANREMQTFSAAQARVFLDAIQSSRYQALFALALSTGMRQGELLGLTWENVDLERGVIYVKSNLQWLKRDDSLPGEHTRTEKSEPIMQEPKTSKSRRMVFIGSLVKELMVEHRARQAEMRQALQWQNQKWNLVFTTLKGGPLHPSTLVHLYYEPLLKKAGLPKIRFHDLRHTAASLLLEAGINSKVVSEMLGHSSVTITLTLYAHATPAMHYTASVVMDKVLRGEMVPMELPDRATE